MFPWLSGASSPSLPPDLGSLVVTSLSDATPAGWRVKPHQLHVAVGPGAQLAAARPQTGFFTGNCAFCFLPIFCAPRLTQDPSSRLREEQSATPTQSFIARTEGFGRSQPCCRRFYGQRTSSRWDVSRRYWQAKNKLKSLFWTDHLDATKSLLITCSGLILYNNY